MTLSALSRFSPLVQELQVLHFKYGCMCVYTVCLCLTVWLVGVCGLSCYVPYSPASRWAFNNSFHLETWRKALCGLKHSVVWMPHFSGSPGYHAYAIDWRFKWDEMQKEYAMIHYVSIYSIRSMHSLIIKRDTDIKLNHCTESFNILGWSACFCCLWLEVCLIKLRRKNVYCIKQNYIESF